MLSVNIRGTKNWKYHPHDKIQEGFLKDMSAKQTTKDYLGEEEGKSTAEIHKHFTISNYSLIFMGAGLFIFYVQRCIQYLE